MQGRSPGNQQPQTRCGEEGCEVGTASWNAWDTKPNKAEIYQSKQVQSGQKVEPRIRLDMSSIFGGAGGAGKAPKRTGAEHCKLCCRPARAFSSSSPSFASRFRSEGRSPEGPAGGCIAGKNRAWCQMFGGKAGVTAGTPGARCKPDNDNPRPSQAGSPWPAAVGPAPGPVDAALPAGAGVAEGTAWEGTGTRASGGRVATARLRPQYAVLAVPHPKLLPGSLTSQGWQRRSVHSRQI